MIRTRFAGCPSLFDPAKVSGSIRSHHAKLIKQILFPVRMSKPPANIHDAFFKSVMSEPECAGQFLREHLPPEIAALLSDDPPELQSGSFVDEDLAQHQTDLLFRITLKEGGEALTYVLAEHKSAPDPLARLQLLRYVTRVLARWHRENKRLPLPAVVPLLAHHGPSGWSFSTDFADLYGSVADSLRPFLLTFRHALVDLAHIDDTALSQHLRLRAFLKALKYIMRTDLAEHLDSLLAEALGLDRMDFELVVQYLGRKPLPASQLALDRALHRLTSEKSKMMEGFLDYRERMGFAACLIRVLELRFGPLTTDFRERVLEADMPCLESWLTRANKESKLEAVFE